MSVSRAAPALEWEQIRIFLAVMRERSLAGAAARLGLDVSTVSRRLDRLEDELGAVLFDRDREGTRPTVAAEEMLPYAEDMELAAARFSAAGAKVETRAEGTVRVTMPPGLADVFVAPRLVELYRKHPSLVVEIDASVSYADLTRREADLAVRATRPTSGDLVAVQLIATRAIPMTSAAYARELGVLARLEDARWIAWGDDLAHIPTGRWLREYGPNIRPVLKTSHYASQLAASRAGLGLVLAAAPFAHTGLVPVRPGKALAAAWAALPVESLWLVGHRALRNVPRVAAVWDFLIESFGAKALARLEAGRHRPPRERRARRAAR